MRRWIPIVLAAVMVTLVAAPPASARTSRAVNCAKVKCIALTFDDGPGPYTGKLLDLLRKHHTKVTFFLVGARVEKYRKTALRMAREGHEIGNHTWSHPHLTSLSDDEIREEIGRTQDAIEHATGKAPGLLRPPYGDTDDRVGSVAAEMGLAQIVWNGTSRDWELRNTVAVTKKVLGLAKRDRVVLMHDVWPETVKAMPKILATLEKRGYHVVPVSKLLRGRELGAGEVYPVGGWN
ncbi:polysaccharide deacetylase family protein [Sphaerisporangium corydalis]|uniref:Polysaccharide deacetylase family protein n=1 Tax=Sphaerisporangium corydalis TaxID=1441875 RepID=A0ABV9EPK3_9ACTN|nr:polysaccharide deacetylase family protein [Sphaerisporangium corydalis]